MTDLDRQLEGMFPPPYHLLGDLAKACATLERASREMAKHKGMEAHRDKLRQAYGLVADVTLRLSQEWDQHQHPLLRIGRT